MVLHYTVYMSIYRTITILVYNFDYVYNYIDVSVSTETAFNHVISIPLVGETAGTIIIYMIYTATCPIIILSVRSVQSQLNQLCVYTFSFSLLILMVKLFA